MKWYLLLSVVLCIALLFVWFGPELMHDSDGLIPTTQSTEHTEERHIHHYSVRESLPATCTEDGFDVASCECGDSFRVTTELAKGHRFEFFETIPPTETKGGYTLYVCHCGAEKRTDETQPFGELLKLENLCFQTDRQGTLYYYYKNAQGSTELMPVCETPVLCYGYNDRLLFFVKESEPGNLYFALLTELSVQSVFYSSDLAPITGINVPFEKDAKNEVLIIQTDTKVFVLDLLTRECTLVVEPPHVIRLDGIEVYPYKDENGKWTFDPKRILINGQLYENQEGSYYYNMYTGLYEDVVGGYVMLWDEPLADSCATVEDDQLAGFYFIKKNEPTKLYYTTFADTTKHTLIYESKNGEITGPYYYSDIRHICLTIGHKQSILLNLSTGETSVFLEMPEINRANIRDIQIVDGKITYHLIYFEGKKPGDTRGSCYLYDISSGTFEHVGQGNW